MLRSRTPRHALALLAAAGTAALTGCSSDGGSSATASAPPAGQQTASTPTAAASPVPKAAAQYAGALKGRLARVRGVVKVTEDNDPNGIIGRPTGYTSAAVLVDKAGKGCGSGQITGKGVDCGAFLEVWPSAQAAKDRAEYIQGVLKKMPMLGTEYDYRSGAALLRVSGKLKPSVAGQYKKAWQSLADKEPAS